MKFVLRFFFPHIYLPFSSIADSRLVFFGPQINTDFLKFQFVSTCLLASRFVSICGQSFVDSLLRTVFCGQSFADYEMVICQWPPKSGPIRFITFFCFSIAMCF
jgi:hypothetical protein